LFMSVRIIILADGYIKRRFLDNTEHERQYIA